MNENKPPNEDGFFAGIRKSNLIRSRQRWIGGVSSAVADRTRLDLTLVRGLFIITALFGVGFLAYGAAWLLLPEEGTGTILAEDASRGRIEGPLIAAGAFHIIGFWERSRLQSAGPRCGRLEEHTPELQSRGHLVCRLLL